MQIEGGRRRARRRSRVAGVVLTVVAVGGLAGCGRDASTAPVASATVANGFEPGMKYSQILADFVTCMDAAGWKVKVSWSGGVETVGDVPQGQYSAWTAAGDACSRSTKWGAVNDLENFTPAQIKRLYGQEVATHECFAAHGWNTKEPPSEQQYIDTFASKDQYYGMAPAALQATQAQLKTMVTACPPPMWFPDGVGF